VSESAKGELVNIISVNNVWHRAFTEGIGFLQKARQHDVVLAGDVFIHLGDLAPVDSARSRSVPAGFSLSPPNAPMLRTIHSHNGT
jgi:hypothetical protein